MILFLPSEPFEIPCQINGKQKRITKSDVRNFWKQAGSEMSEKKGCYIFALRASLGCTPWYVGKATKTFKQEALHLEKLVKYNDILFANNHGTPVMFFVAPPTLRESKKATEAIEEMEKHLIGAAFLKNPKIANVHHAKKAFWGIKGVLKGERGGQGRPTNEEKAFKTMMGI